MGKAMKSKPLKKGPKAKAKAKSQSSCKKNKAGSKAAMKTLTSANLRRLEKSQGQMSLQDKLKKAGEEDTEEGAKAILQKLMTKDEKTKLWSKHQTYLRGSQDEKSTYDEASKKEKTDMTLMWLLKKEHPKYYQVSNEVEGTTKAERSEHWISETAMLTKWTWEELQMHLASGRIVTRGCASTWAVWEYCDMQDWKTVQAAKAKKRARIAQEYVPNSDDEMLLDTCMEGNMRANASKLLAQKSSSSKGLGKSPKGKGKSKEKGKGNTDNQLALQDKDATGDEDEEEDKTEEEQLKDAYKKAKKARDVTAAVCADFEDCLTKANPYLNKASKQNGLKDQQLLAAMSTKLKEAVSKENVPLKKLKSMLQEAANKVKEVKETMKELKQLANKAGSIASKAASAKSKK